MDAIVAAFVSAGIEGVASADVRRKIWEKFAFLAANSAVTAVTRETIGALRARPQTRALIREAIEEVVAVARGEGVEVTPGFVEGRMRFVDSLPAEGRASMAKDLLRGSRLELEWLSGAVARRGERLGVPAPVHRALYAALLPFAGGAPSRQE